MSRRMQVPPQKMHAKSETRTFHAIVVPDNAREICKRAKSIVGMTTIWKANWLLCQAQRCGALK
jgi:hypothetical protein